MGKSNHILWALALPFILLGANVFLLHTDPGLGYSRETLFLYACLILLPVVLILQGLYIYISKKKELIPTLAIFSGSSIISLLLQVHYVWGWWCPCIGSN
jgi:hypothetical protein